MRPALRLLTAVVAGGIGLTAARAAPDRGMVLGVATHFDQGWPIGLLAQAKAAGAQSLRDDVPWAKGEPKPGVYDFSDARLGFARRACAAGSDVLLVVDPRHPGYDNGDTAYSPAAQRAFGTYLAKMLDQLPKGCVAGIEVGNEINADQAIKLPAGKDRVATYVALLRAVRDAIRPTHPDVAIVGASTNVIGTGFVETIAAAGGLDVMDAVAIHPYRNMADSVDLELERLVAAMRRHGTPKPIWATEFGNYFTDPAAAPPLLIKMATMLAAADVRRSYWYALIDESYFPNMGLFDGQGRDKPAADAFRLARTRILAGGAPVRIDAGDRRSFVYRLASGGYVMWGDPRPLAITGSKVVRDTRGAPVAPPARLSDDPILLPPGAQYTLGVSPVLADSLPEFGRAPWQYLAQPASGAPVPLAMRDWQWTSFYGKVGFDPLQVSSNWLAPAGNGAGPVRAIVRYTAPTAIKAEMAACFSKKPAGDGVDVEVLRDGIKIHRTVVTQRTMIEGLKVDLAAGQTLDISVGPNRDAGDDALSYRIRLIRPGSAIAPACAP